MRGVPPAAFLLHVLHVVVIPPASLLPLPATPASAAVFIAVLALSRARRLESLLPWTTGAHLVGPEAGLPLLAVVMVARGLDSGGVDYASGRRMSQWAAAVVFIVLERYWRVL